MPFVALHGRYEVREEARWIVTVLRNIQDLRVDPEERRAMWDKAHDRGAEKLAEMAGTPAVLDRAAGLESFHPDSWVAAGLIEGAYTRLTGINRLDPETYRREDK